MRRRLVARLAALCLLLAAGAVLAAEPFRFTLLHTNDLHSHFEGSGPDALFTPQAGDGDPVRGHYARLLTLIRQVRGERGAAGEPVLLVDAGDSFSGSLFHALAPRGDLPASPELEFFQLAAYDALTPGNHEFDAGEAGYANALEKVRAGGLLTRLVAGNLQAAAATAPVLRTLPKTLLRELRQGDRVLRVGVLGYLGPGGARDCAPTRSTVTLTGYDDAKGKPDLDALAALARAQAAELRRRDKADLVIVLLHGGEGEEEALAKVDGVDLVVAGHTHVLYETPRVFGGRMVVQAGSYGRHLGRLDLAWDGAKLVLRNPGATVLPVDDRVAADPELLARIEAWKAALDRLTAPQGWRYADRVTTVERDLRGGRGVHDPLGRLVTSRIAAVLRRRLPQPPDLFFTELSLIREDWVTVGGKPTPQQFSDVFRMLPLGFGPDWAPGSPIVAFWITPQELKSLIDVMELQRSLGRRGAMVYSDTLGYRVRGWGIPFVNRIADLTLHGKPYEQWPPLVQVATTAYMAAYIPRLGVMTHGLATVAMKDAAGRPLTQPLVLPVPGEAFLFAESFRAR